MLKVRHSNYYQQKLQNNYFQPKVLLLAQPLLLPARSLPEHGDQSEFLSNVLQRWKVQPAYRVGEDAASRVEDIMHEILTEGPVVAVMDVYKDFFYYGDGVYQVNLTM